MSMDLAALLSGQHDIYGRITRSVDNLKKMGAANITLCAVETRRAILDQLWVKFEAHHEAIRNAYKEQFNESEYVKTKLFDTAEDAYVQQRSVLTDYANAIAAAQLPTNTASQSAEQSHKTSLPRIKLQPFSGAYEEWPSFRDLFLSVIGNNSAISDIERFHYLRSCLQGQAE
ncbi:PREDICTED: uncharacterized protein LOC105557659, partial [Vollenhovia emeryi]|uniref:uncharacterized protein LOC105557659 n=1 Tax=Vollenhovia emeryi TaxID=411798 RepID=UPI0005F4800C